MLSFNPNPRAVKLLSKFTNKINWDNLSCNPSPDAIKLLIKNPHQINWLNLSGNNSCEAVELLETRCDKICWSHICSNSCPRVLLLMQKNKHLLNFDILSANSVIFEYDYNQMKLNCSIFKNELIQVVRSKNNFIHKYINKYKYISYKVTQLFLNIRKYRFKFNNKIIPISVIHNIIKPIKVKPIKVKPIYTIKALKYLFSNTNDSTTESGSSSSSSSS